MNGSTDDGFPETTWQLVGRGDEIAALARLRDRLLRGLGGALTLLGEPGIGKSALLDEIALEAGRIAVVRTSGRRGAAPGDGFRELFGAGAAGFDELSGAGSPTTFAAGLAVLDTVMDRAAARPLLCLVDDAHLLDPASQRVLHFLARRLDRLPVALVLAARETGGYAGPAGTAVLSVRPLRTAAAADLLARQSPVQTGSIAPDLLAAAAGNPLALIELPRLLTLAQLTGRHAIVDPVPLGPRSTLGWSDVLATVTPAVRAVLLIAAAAGEVRAGVVAEAAALLGLPDDALSSAESTGLIAVSNGLLTFPRPPVRSVAYHLAACPERREAHQALAAVLTADRDASRLARHLAAAAAGPDEATAALLEATVWQAGTGRAAADALELAADLSVGDDVRGRRLVAAAMANWEAGRPDRASELVRQAHPLPEDVSVRATALLVEGAVALSEGAAGLAFKALVSGAEVALERDRDLAVDLSARIAGMAWWAGGLDWAQRAAELAAAAATEGNAYARFVARAATAGSDLLGGRLEDAGATLRQILPVADTLGEPRHLLHAAEVAGLLGDDETVLRLQVRAIRTLRGRGAVSELPFALELNALALAWQGKVDAAAARAKEGRRQASGRERERDGAFQQTILAHVAALSGDEDACRTHAAAARGCNDPANSAASVHWALGRMALGLGRPDEALGHLAPLMVDEPDHPLVGLFAAPDIVEAAVLGRRPSLAEAALALFGRWNAAGSPWASAVLPRLRALMACPAEADDLFEAATAAPGLASRPFDNARTQLLYGLHLQHRRRRLDARTPLRAALATFETLGLAPWAERARAGLRAAGGTVQPRAGEPVDTLTEGELRVAWLVLRGGSNREVADTLHLSPRTIEYHLSKVYTKLGISSREQLGAALRAG